MRNTLDAVLEILVWVGFGAALLLAVVTMIVWAVDGTWLPADAIVDREDEGTVVRWYGDGGQADRARADDLAAAELGDVDRAPIWYRHGTRGRMRLTPRTPALRPFAFLALGMLGVGLLSLVGSAIALFARG